MIDVTDILTQMRSNGINPPEIVPDEKLHRFPISPSDKKNSGWYKAFRNVTRKGEDFYVVVYGDNHDPDTVHTAHSGVKMDKQDKSRIQEQIRKAQRAQHLEKIEAQNQAAAKAKSLWDSLTEHMGQNEYLQRKGLDDLHGARIHGFNLVIPMRNADGEIRNVERVVGDGSEKRGLFGGQRTGLFHVIGDPGDVIYLCEGFSTAATIHAAMDACSVCAFNAGNLTAVAQVLAQKYPNKKIVICGDNDQWPNKKGEIDNVGRRKAEEAANLCGGKFIVPSFTALDSKPTDFNDLAAQSGLEAVRAQILAVEPTKAVAAFDPKFVVNHPYPDENEATFARKGTLENVAELIRRLRVVVRYNLISKEPEFVTPGLSSLMDNRTNVVLGYLTSWCERCKIPTGNLSSYITMIADANPYNPVVTWIESKKWDGITRLPDLYATITAKGEAEDVHILAMKEKLMRAWMISAVAGAFEPAGVSAHGVLVLQGDQYLGKTAWFKRLVPEHLGVVADGLSLDPSDKDSVFQVISKWLVELGELDASLRSDPARLKAFITKKTDRLRRPYAKSESEFARRTVFFGSVNPDQFLKDPTGNRRFWTIACEKIDHKHSLDMQQVWAEVYDRYKNGESWFLSADEISALNDHNEDFQEISAIEERIRDCYDWKSTVHRPLSATQVCIEIGIRDPKDYDIRQAGRALKKILGERKKMPSGNKGYFVPPMKRGQ